ncbi:MAG: hypothetical protein Q4F13_14150 [Pseudomonadota bacterium]|nr:hypothetical protein [Pseudomonadota bacterium]
MSEPWPPLLPCALAQEHGAVLRHWGRVQERVSQQLCAQARRCEALEAEVLHWRARWMLATTHMAWGLGWPGLPARAGPARAAQGARPAPEEKAPTLNSATDVICQTGCAGHAHPWRSQEGECALTGSDCTRVPPLARSQS